MYIGRKPDLTIFGLWTTKQWNGQEELPDDNEEIIAFATPERRPPGAKRAKLIEMSVACKASIENGFVSNALSIGTLYPSAATDQLNLSGRVSESLVKNSDATWTGSVMCKDAAGVWARRQHSHAHIRQVGLDAVAWVAVQLDKLDQRRSAIAAATTVDDVKAIVWA